MVTFRWWRRLPQAAAGRASSSGRTASSTRVRSSWDSAAKARWYANANDIADFLAQANPKFWPDSVMRDDMRVHLDQTLAEAAHELEGDYTASVADYEAVHAHILQMADMLSGGIIGAFPGSFH